MELDIGRAYITQKATSLMRHSPTEVVLGGVIRSHLVCVHVCMCVCVCLMVLRTA